VLIIAGIILIIFHDKGSFSVPPETILQTGIIFLIAGILILVFTKKSIDYYKKRGNPVY
jgi:hypothetical protein